MIVIALIVTVICTAAVVLVPETHHPTLLRRRAMRRNELHLLPPQPSLAHRLKLAILRPPRFMLLEPMVSAACAVLALLYGILFLFFSGLPVVYIEQLGFTRVQLGLTYISLLIGFTASYLFVFIWNDKWITAKMREAKERGHPPAPEIWLRQGVLTILCCPAGLLIFAFTSYTDLRAGWVGMCVGEALFCFGLMTNFYALIFFVVSAFREHAASAGAAMTIARSLTAAAFPLFSAGMVHRLSPRGAMGLLGGLIALLSPIPYLLERYGPKLRSMSRFAPS